MTTATTFFGVPIEGSIYKGRRGNTTQKSAEDFARELNKVFAFPEVEAIKWRQYTPYFNDGDTCEFGLGEVGFKITGVDEDAGDYEDGYVSSGWGRHDESVAAVIGKGNYARAKEAEHDGQGNVELWRALRDFENEFGGQYEVALYEAFGDHATVTVTREKIVVDTYDHD